MHDIDKELIELLKKYGLTMAGEKPTFHQLLYGLFEDMWRRIPDDLPIAVFGVGIKFQMLYERVFKRYPKRVVCFIENQRNERSIDGIPVVPINRAGEYGPHSVFLCSYDFSQEMSEEARKHLPAAKMIDIRDEMERRGYTRNDTLMDDLVFSYEHIGRDLIAYKRDPNGPDAAHVLKRLICRYLAIRDFVYAQKYIGEYIEMGYDDGSCRCFLDELNMLFDSVRRRLKLRENRQVVVFLVDGLSYEMAKSMPSLHDTEKRLIFTNAYAAAYQTRGSCYSAFSGKHYVQDGLYKNDYLYLEDCALVREMREKGCIFKLMGTEYFHFLKQVNDYEIDHDLDVLQPMQYWNMLGELLHEESDSITVIYSCEIHYPFISGHPSKQFMDCQRAYDTGAYFEMFEGTEQERFNQLVAYQEEQLRSAMDYCDKQLAFYTGFLSEENYPVVIMSDHGGRPTLYGAAGRTETADSAKSTLIIRSHMAGSGIYDGMYSLIDLENVLRGLLWGEGTLDITRFDYARREMEPYYGKLISKAASDPFSKGHIRIFNEQEEYILFLNGDERYKSALCPDLDAAGEEYRARVKFFRGMIHVDLRELWRSMLEKYPRMRQHYDDAYIEAIGEKVKELGIGYEL